MKEPKYHHLLSVDILISGNIKFVQNFLMECNCLPDIVFCELPNMHLVLFYWPRCAIPMDIDKTCV